MKVHFLPITFAIVPVIFKFSLKMKKNVNKNQISVLIDIRVTFLEINIE